MKLAASRSLSRSSLALLATCLLAPFSSPAQAGENISGFMDPTGRVVFVNEPSEVSAASRLSTSQVSTKRKLLAKASALPKVSELAVEEAVFHPVEWARTSEFQTGVSELGRASQSTGRDRIQEMVSEAARRHSVDADLVHAIVRVESNYNPYATSNKGARGLMQLIPATARRFGVSNSYDPSANLDGGIRYLKYLMSMFHGDLRLSLAAYNAGEMAVTRNGGIPPYRETQDYVRKISELYPLRTAAAAVGVAPEPQIVRYLDASGVVHFSNTDTP